MEISQKDDEAGTRWILNHLDTPTSVDVTVMNKESLHILSISSFKPKVKRVERTARRDCKIPLDGDFPELLVAC